MCFICDFKSWSFKSYPQPHHCSPQFSCLLSENYRTFEAASPPFAWCVSSSTWKDWEGWRWRFWALPHSPSNLPQNWGNGWKWMEMAHESTETYRKTNVLNILLWLWLSCVLLWLRGWKHAIKKWWWSCLRYADAFTWYTCSRTHMQSPATQNPTVWCTFEVCYLSY